jgi:hypothetical protein
MVSRSLVLAYHGCDLSVARRVASGKDQLRYSKNDYDWLGSGLYFWEDSQARALQWAQHEAARGSGKVKKPAVLGAVIDLGNCLNLIDVEDLALVTAAHEEYQKICQEFAVLPAQNKGSDLRARYLDKAVFETLHKLREQTQKQPFETVRAFFVEGKPLYAGAGLRDLDHIQICVRDPKKIVGYFLPR